MRRILCTAILFCGVVVAQTTFTANINLRNLAWTSTVDQQIANQDRNTDCAYYLYNINRSDLLQKDGAGAFVVTAGGDLKLDPALTNAQVSAIIAEDLAKKFKENSDAGYVAFQQAKALETIRTVRRNKAQP